MGGRWRTGGGGGGRRLVVQLGEQRVSEAEKASVLFCFHIFGLVIFLGIGLEIPFSLFIRFISFFVFQNTPFFLYLALLSFRICKSCTLKYLKISDLIWFAILWGKVFMFFLNIS